MCTSSSLKGFTQQLKMCKFYKEALFDWIVFTKTLQSQTMFLNPDTPQLFGNSGVIFKRKCRSFSHYLEVT